MSRLLAISPTTRVVLHEKVHEVKMGCQKLLQADQRARWWRWCIATWDLSTPMSGRSLGDIEDWVLRGPCTHHLP
jgi:hypothetical protein